MNIAWNWLDLIVPCCEELTNNWPLLTKWGIQKVRNIDKQSILVRLPSTWRYRPAKMEDGNDSRTHILIVDERGLIRVNIYQSEQRISVNDRRFIAFQEGNLSSEPPELYYIVVDVGSGGNVIYQTDDGVFALYGDEELGETIPGYVYRNVFHCRPSLLQETKEGEMFPSRLQFTRQIPYNSKEMLTVPAKTREFRQVRSAAVRLLKEEVETFLASIPQDEEWSEKYDLPAH